MKVGDRVKVINEDSVFFNAEGNVVALYNFEIWPIEIEIENSFVFVGAKMDGFLFYEEEKTINMIFDCSELELINA